MFKTRGHISSDNLNREYLYSLVSQYDLFKYYIPSFKEIKTLFKSELRKDRAPTCGIIKITNGNLLYKDFGTGQVFSCVKYVQHKYGLSYVNALKKIFTDFRIAEYEVKELKDIKETSDVIIEKCETTPASIKIVSIPFNKSGLLYWQQYGVNESLLNLFEVKQISHFTINGYQTALKKEVAFAYCFGKYRYKLLRPFTTSANKWRNNATSNVVQGFRQLPKEGGDLLIITKALKDVMCLRGMDYYSIAPQSENTLLPEALIPWLKERWLKIVIIYDNDEPGIRAASEHSERYDIPYAISPMDEKDTSDYYKEHGKIKTELLISNLISNV
jgi:hypothetical protein